MTEPAAGAVDPAADPAPAGLGLAVPDEPEALRQQTRADVLGGKDLGTAIRAPGGLGPWWWGCWRDQLEAAGLGQEAFLAVVDAYRREIWFWVLGDRRWDPLVTGLAGRLGRRVPDPAP